MTLDDVINHARHRNYLEEIDRDYLRVKATGEVFTPLSVITKKLDDLESYDPDIFKDPTKKFLEPSCGDGNFLSEVLIRKMQNGSTFEQALETVYGVDLMQDNVDLCRERLLCGSRDLVHITIVQKNIYQANALKFSYKFKPMSDTRQKREESLRAKEKQAKEKRLKEEERKKAEEQKIKIEKKLFGESLCV
jgi:hypothetical protein